ncbi:MAG: GFA family protein [Novosphingobium sp.]|nr:GFA family protein [Novosphingobium sp.]
MAETPSVTITGQCRCGEVRFAFDGPVLLTAACHCRGCQRMTGSAFSLTTATVLSRFTVTKGETVLGGLRGDARHHFCDGCKSWLFTTHEALRDMVNVRTTMLDQLPAEPPFVEMFTDEALPWVKTGAKHSFAQFPAADEFGPLMQEFAATAAG